MDLVTALLEWIGGGLLIVLAVAIGVLVHRQRQRGSHHVGGTRRPSFAEVDGARVTTLAGGNAEPEPEPDRLGYDDGPLPEPEPLALASPPLAAEPGPDPLDLEARRRFYPGEPGNVRLAGPPMINIVAGGVFRENVEPVTLRDWLAKYHPKRQTVWDEVVVEFYNRAAKVPPVASYFGLDVAEDSGLILNMTDEIAARLRDLQRHFLANLLIVAHTGVTVATVRCMWRAHCQVRNLHGEPIDSDIYDLVVGTLAGVIADKLTECRIDPEPVIDQLAATIEPLHAAIVAEPVG